MIILISLIQDIVYTKGIHTCIIHSSNWMKRVLNIYIKSWPALKQESSLYNLIKLMN